KQYEAKISGAEEKIACLELRFFNELILWMHSYIEQVQKNSSIIAQFVCLCVYAQLAQQNNHNPPELDDSFDLDIVNAMHTVIEKQLQPGESYIANSTFLDRKDQQIIMITGPNMSGKSAILRQTALIVLLAQIGSFVPAEKARIGIIDKIFTRVGASDN